MHEKGASSTVMSTTASHAVGGMLLSKGRDIPGTAAHRAEELGVALAVGVQVRDQLLATASSKSAKYPGRAAHRAEELGVALAVGVQVRDQLLARRAHQVLGQRQVPDCRVPACAEAPRERVPSPQR